LGRKRGIRLKVSICLKKGNDVGIDAAGRVRACWQGIAITVNGSCTVCYGVRIVPIEFSRSEGLLFRLDIGLYLALPCRRQKRKAVLEDGATKRAAKLIALRLLRGAGTGFTNGSLLKYRWRRSRVAHELKGAAMEIIGPDLVTTLMMPAPLRPYSAV